MNNFKFKKKTFYRKIIINFFIILKFIKVEDKREKKKM